MAARSSELNPANDPRRYNSPVGPFPLPQERPLAELKTKPTEVSVADFLAAIPDEKKRQDSLTIAEMLREATGAEPKMWGTSIVGYGDRHYTYASGRQGDWFV